MYAAFGQVEHAANRLVTQQWVRYGFLSDQQTVLGALYDLATKHLGWLILLLVSTKWAPVLDHLAERTGSRILGLVMVLIGRSSCDGDHGWHPGLSDVSTLASGPGGDSVGGGDPEHPRPPHQNQCA